MSAKSYTVEKMLAGRLSGARSVMADDAQEAAQIYAGAQYYADAAFVGRYEPSSSLMVGQMQAVGGWHYRVGTMHVRVTEVSS
jgi:hypothetical protein